MTPKQSYLRTILEAAKRLDDQYPSPCLRAAGGLLMVPITELTPATYSLVDAAGVAVRRYRGRLYAMVPDV